jgi:hypothetical protein
VSIFERFWNRLRGKETDPTIGTQIGLVAGAVAVSEAAHDGETPDYGWSGDHASGGSDFGGGGGFDGGGAGGDSGGGGF